MASKKVLVFGIGNVGRMDDGLGIKLSMDLEKKYSENGLDFDANYQLNVEDAYAISNYDMVVFADASLKAQAPFQIEELKPSIEIQFSTHAMSPDSILALCHELYKKHPQTYLLTMPGYDFGIGEELTEEASKNLELAKDFLVKFIQDYSLSQNA